MDKDIFKNFETPDLVGFISDPDEIMDTVGYSLDSIYTTLSMASDETVSDEVKESIRKTVVDDTKGFVMDSYKWLFAEADKRDLKPFSVFVCLLYNLHVVVKAMQYLYHQDIELAKKLGFTEEDCSDLFESFLKGKSSEE